MFVSLQPVMTIAVHFVSMFVERDRQPYKGCPKKVDRDGKGHQGTMVGPLKAL